jgi:hypothetical protein
LTIFFACPAVIQSSIGVGVKAELIVEFEVGTSPCRAMRLRTSLVGADHVPLWRAGVARAPVARTKGSRVEKRMLNSIETSG